MIVGRAIALESEIKREVKSDNFTGKAITKSTR